MQNLADYQLPPPDAKFIAGFKGLSLVNDEILYRIFIILLLDIDQFVFAFNFFIYPFLYKLRKYANFIIKLNLLIKM